MADNTILIPAAELAAKNKTHLPNESPEYRQARNALLAEEIELRRHIERVAALRRAMPDALTGELTFVSVIEEECTGNGTLAAAKAGVLGDAVLLLEPTGLDLLLGGVGVLWVEIEIEGVPAHAEAADRAVNPIGCVPAVLRAFAHHVDVGDLKTAVLYFNIGNSPGGPVE